MTGNFKQVWQTDREGFLIGPTVADESPLEPGVYLIPAGCVEVAPPEDRADGKVARWNGKRWERVKMPAAPVEPGPKEKLAAFLAANPDVRAMLDD